MCLIAECKNEQLLFTAEEDIVCVKAVEVIREEEFADVEAEDLSEDAERHVTPYRFMEITQDVLDGKADLVPQPLTKEPPLYRMITSGTAEIEEGFLHTYAVSDRYRTFKALYDEIRFLDEEISRPEEFLKEMNRVMGVEIWLCVIPKGANYAEGKTWDGHPGYASSALRFKERMVSITEVKDIDEITEICAELTYRLTGEKLTEEDMEEIRADYL